MFKYIVEDNFFENDLKELQSIVENKSELEEINETKSIVVNLDYNLQKYFIDKYEHN